MKKPLIKIYGERNTGTNYLYKLIELNLAVCLLRGSDPEILRSVQRWLPGHELLLNIYSYFSFQRNLGWKHSLVMPVHELSKMKICSENIHFITLTKNPYSWLLSLYKRPYHYHYHFNFFKNPSLWLISHYRRPYHYTVKKATFEEFLSSPWIPTRRERSTKTIENPVLLWNQKNASYIQLRDKFPVINLRYENLVLDPEKVIGEISNRFSLRNKAKKFKNVSESTKGDKKDFLFYKRYYLEEQWREELSPESISFIKKYLDIDLMDYYHYKILS
jgi:hypothetical protein